MRCNEVLRLITDMHQRLHLVDHWQFSKVHAVLTRYSGQSFTSDLTEMNRAEEQTHPARKNSKTERRDAGRVVSHEGLETGAGEWQTPGELKPKRDSDLRLDERRCGLPYV